MSAPERSPGEIVSTIVRQAKASQDAVLHVQIDHLYRQLPYLLIFSLPVALGLALMLRSAVPMEVVRAWLLVTIIFVLARLFLYLRYRKNDRQRPARYWAYWYVVLAGISGLVWGSVGVFLFVPGNLELQTLVFLVLAGLGAASVSVLPMYLPAFYAYLPASLIPAGAMMLNQGNDFHLAMGIFVFIFLLALLTFGRATGAAFRNSLELRYENIELVSMLEKQKNDLQLANLAKSKFLAAASHDLRQPLHALSLFSELLGKQAKDQQTRELADRISGSVSVLDRLFSALLDISRIDAGVLKPEFELFPIRRVAERVYSDSLPKARAKNLDLYLDCEEVYTESDPTLLGRILRNLVSNSIRYTPSGNVTIRCKPLGHSLQLSVIDSGIGIAANQKEIIFEEFTQLGNPERDKTQGLGLGLSIVKRLANLLRHPLELHSEPGKGTRFSLTLPYIERPILRPARPESKFAAKGVQLALSVLVVDDDLDILEGTRQLLESWGCTVVTAATSENAIQLAGEMKQLDALVTDLRLPEHEWGTQLVQSIRELRGSHIPSLLITGDLEPERLQEAREFSLDLLHKPVRPARLRAWLQRLQPD